ncbi:hypothetical protein [Streptomyces sp. NPDC005017]|uniref:hypothetical protein n=1 Tax=Streptomyces sp. NPDC005017 TaxID=3364706 RepID=UPI0036A4352F
MASGLIADWALWGKVPRTTRGYEVLAAHPSDRSGEFNDAIQHWTPGTPSAGDRLPWITIGCAPQGAGTGTVGVFLLDESADFDISNRVIHRISHFAVPYPQVRDAGVGWCALARATSTAAEGLSRRTGPVELAYGEEDLLVNDIAANITTSVSATTRWLAAAAAYLLDGPVAVTGNSGSGPFGVLRMLDTVAALLPFGVRSTLSAATSISPGAQVPMRLFWGDPLDTPGVTSLPLSGELPDLGGLSQQARTYHDLLLENWTEHGGDAVVRHLADVGEPLDIADERTPEYALEVLTDLNPALAAAQEISEGRPVTRERMRHVLLNSPQISTGPLTVLMGQVMADPNPDLEAVAPRLAEKVVSQAFRDQLRRDLLDGQTRAALASFENMRAARTAAGLDLDPLDEILAGVMDESLDVCGPGEPDPVTEWLLPGVAPFAEGTMDLTQSMLRQRPGLASRLVRALYDQPEPGPLVRSWLDWLCGERDPRRSVEIAGSAELPLLYSVLSTGVGLAGASRKWDAGQPGASALLLEGAVVCGHGNEVLQHPGFLDTLVGTLRPGAAGPDGTDPGELLTRALARRPDGLRPEAAALWDVLCALKGLPPSGFTTVIATPPGTSGPETRVATYASALKAVLEGKLLRRYAADIARNLLAGVLAVDPDTGQGPGPAGRTLTLHILDWSDSYAQPVLDSVHALAAETPHWDETDKDAEWLDKIALRLPPLRSVLVLREVLRLAQQATDTAEDCDALAARAGAARRAGAGSDQLCAALMFWAVRGEGRIGERTLAVFDAYQKDLTRFVGAGRAFEERAELENAIAGVHSEHPLLTYYCDHVTRLLTRQDSEAVGEIRKLEDQRLLLKGEMERLRKLKASGHTRT